MFPRILCVVIISHGLLAAQEPSESPASDEAAITETGDSTAPAVPAQDGNAAARTFILDSLEVPPFAPPVPVPPKVLPRVRVDAAVTLPSKNSRTLTLQRGEPSTEPDLPPPPPPVVTEPAALTPEEVARRIWESHHNFNLGATVYDHKISVVDWTDPETGVFYQATCGFDIGLLAGLGHFIYRGEHFRFMLVHINLSTTVLRQMAARWSVRVPVFPEVPDGQILINRGDAADLVGTAPVVVLGELIAAEKHRLLPYQAARNSYYAASAAWYAAHPPIPRDETFILRPHRGSRYLTNPEPATP